MKLAQITIAVSPERGEIALRLRPDAYRAETRLETGAEWQDWEKRNVHRRVAKPSSGKRNRSPAWRI